MKSLPDFPAVAAFIRAVTSVIAVSWLSSISGHFTSSFSALAKKPLLTRSRLAVESCSMHWCAQWWFVITRPSGETKLPEQPPARRTDDSRTRSSQAWSGENP